MVPAQLYCVLDFVVETNGGQLCSPHSSLWQKIRYVIFESAGEETRVCFNMVLCRLIAEVSALVDDHLVPYSLAGLRMQIVRVFP
jgi:hypothetical protein